MKSLETCYEINFSKINFIERKVKITNPKTIISGASKTGKTYLIYDFLSNFKSNEYLYIDFSDLRNDLIEIAKNLEEFIKKNEIIVLILENFEFQFSIPSCENIIISTSNNQNIEGFEHINLYALDFEEYLLHDNKHQNITQSFNSFLKFGNLPEIINLEDEDSIMDAFYDLSYDLLGSSEVYDCRAFINAIVLYSPVDVFVEKITL